MTDKKERKTTSLKVNPELWEEVKIHCIRQKTDISDWLEEVIRKELKKK
jgi:predicted HicB family RNase H-like nuclease